MIECLHKMGKEPKIVYTDDEGALSKESVQTYFTEQKNRGPQDKGTCQFL